MTNSKTAWHHIRRSPFQSLAALIVVSFSCLLFSLFYLVSQGMHQTLIYFETKPEITIFLKDGLSIDIVQSVQNDLASYQDIREIRFISKEKALEIYQEQNKDSPLLLEMVTSDILPASFEISANSPQVLDKINQDFSNRTDIVDELVYQKDIISTLLNWTAKIRTTGLVFIVIFSLVSFSVIFTIIGMKITNRKDEIHTSRLLGAGKSYITKPFLLEGFFYGFIGGIVGNLIVFVSTYFLKDQINNFFSPIDFVDFSPLNIIKIISISIASSSVLTLFASLNSVKRYFKF